MAESIERIAKKYFYDERQHLLSRVFRGENMVQKLSTFMNDNQVRIVDTCVAVLLGIATIVFAKEFYIIFLLTMAFRPFQEMIRQDKITGSRLFAMIVYGLVLTLLPCIACLPIVSVFGEIATLYVKSILQCLFWAKW